MGSNIEEYHDFSQQSRLFDFGLLVEGKELWVPKAALASHSDALETMLYDSRYTEAEEGKAELPNKKFCDVLEWLRCILVCPNKKIKPVDGRYLKLYTVGPYTVLRPKAIVVFIQIQFYSYLGASKLSNRIFNLP